MAAAITAMSDAPAAVITPAPRASCEHLRALLSAQAIPALPTLPAATTVSAADSVDASFTPLPHPAPLSDLHALLMVAASNKAAVPVRRTGLKATVAVQLPRCSVANCAHPSRTLMACTGCVTVSCWAPSFACTGGPSHVAHARSHAAERGHPVALDLSRLAFYCFSCADYVYSPQLDALLTSLAADARTRKRTRDALQEIDALPNKLSSIIKERTKLIGRDPLAGVRGMFNLGNTCFMSVVVQSLMHNPLLRLFFLSDKHNRHRCARRAKAIASIAANAAGSGATQPSSSHVCLACDVDDLFSSFYSGDHSAAVPDHFLLSIWTHAEHLAGYAQQDAHEMLMATLDGIHDGCKDNMEAEAAAAAAAAATAASSSSSGAAPAAPRSNAACRCIVHSVFGGTLRSDVRCNTCGTISTALDAMLDLSLDIVMPPAAAAAGSGLHTPTAASVAAAAASARASPLSLLSCLSRFTRLEQLFNADKFFCGTCSSSQDSTKQMSVHTLPLTLCLHLKRFDHGGGLGAFGGAGNGGSGSGASGAGSKIDAYVSFPLRDLDLSPYLHSELLSPLSPAVGSRNLSSSGSGATRSSAASSSSSLSSRLYDVFCVIVHKGSLDTGHYLCYLRVPLAPDDPDHRQYLLFYIRQQLPDVV